MARIKIEWLADNHDCETCGPTWAEGARVTIDGKRVLELEPHAYCYDGTDYNESQVLRKIIEVLGYVIEESGE